MESQNIVVPHINQESGKTTNLNDILASLNDETDKNTLKDYHEEFTTLMEQFPFALNPEDLAKVKSALDEKLHISPAKFISTLKTFTSEEEVNAEELEILEIYGAKLLGDMQSGNIDYNNQNALDTLILVFQEKSISSPLITSYQEQVEKQHRLRLEQEKLTSPKKLELKDQQGTINTIAVIEITILAALLIVFLLLVKF